MTEHISLSFEQFLRERNEAKSMEAWVKALFSTEAGNEWQRLKDRIREIAHGKRLGMDLFEWSPYPAADPDFLKLKDVALSFEAGRLVGDAPQRYRIVFSRRPLRPNEMWPDAEPIPAERWWLNLEREDDVLYWEVKASRIRMTTENFAEHVAMQFVEYQQRYINAIQARYPWASA